jgi:chromosome segregation protein
MGRVEGMIVFEEKRLKKREEEIARAEDIPLRLGEVEIAHRDADGDLSDAESSGDIGHIKWRIGNARAKLRDFIAGKRAAAGQRGLSSEDYAELEGLKRERAAAEESLRGIEEEARAMEEEYRSVKASIDAEKERSRDTERAIFEMVARRGEIGRELDRVRAEEEDLARARKRLEEELVEAGTLLGRAVLDYSSVALIPEEVMVEDREKQESRRRELERGKIRLEDLGAQGGGAEVEKEYQETIERDAFLTKEMEDLTRTAESLRALITELDEKLDTEFKDGVKKINKQFEDFFRLMFGGGVASLQVVRIEKRRRKDTDLDLSDIPGQATPLDDEEDEEGVEVSVSLPHKKIRGLQMLSGGERALTSIALLFAISRVNPPPFMVLDETDAALDEANSRKYGDMIESLAKLSQLMVITHNRETMSRAGVLYGVTMGSDAVSRVLSISFREAEETAK